MIPIRLIIHCSATPNLSNKFDAFDIDKWHRKRGWKSCGYHKVFKPDGEVQDYSNSPCRSVNVPGAHVEGHNLDSLGWCLMGTNRFSEIQIEQLIEHYFSQAYKIFNIDPKSVYGHYQFADKECPGFEINLVRKLFEQRIKLA